MMRTEKNFHRLANTALGVMEKISKYPKVARRFFPALDKIVNEATDAIAEGLMESRVQNADTRYGKLRGQFIHVLEAIEEGWFMFPGIGLTNNFAGSGPMPDTGVEPWGIVDLADANDSGKANTVGPRDAQGGVNSDLEGLAKKAMESKSSNRIAKKILEGK